MLEYLRQFILSYDTTNKFAYVHMSPGHEDTGTVIRTADKDLKEFLKWAFEYYKDMEEDIVIVVLSDHGKLGKVNEEEKRYENILPFHFMFANKDLITKSSLGKIIKHNSERLNSRYD